MACTICGREKVYHGSEHPSAHPGTYLIESGCHNGCWMDDDEYAEGWDPDVVILPCPYNPSACKKCGGQGWTAEIEDNGKYEPNPEQIQVSCKFCNASGWEGGVYQEPDDRYSNPATQGKEE